MPQFSLKRFLMDVFSCIAAYAYDEELNLPHVSATPGRLSFTATSKAITLPVLNSLYESLFYLVYAQI